MNDWKIERLNNCVQASTKIHDFQKLQLKDGMIKRIFNDWTIDGWRKFKTCIFIFLDWLNDWRIDRLWKFKMYILYFLNDWMIERLIASGNFDTSIRFWMIEWVKKYIFLSDWRIEGLMDRGKFNTSIFFWMIERLNDWWMIQFYNILVYFFEWFISDK